MSFRYLFTLVVVLSLFTFGCTTSSQADAERLRLAEREAELDREMEAMRIAVQVLEGSEICQGGIFFGEDVFDRCLSAIEKAYRFILEAIMQEEQSNRKIEGNYVISNSGKWIPRFGEIQVEGA